MMNKQQTPWYMQQGVRLPDHVKPGEPRRETAQEFFTRVIELGRFAKEQYLGECRAGLRTFDQVVVNELDENIAICAAELEKYK